MDMNMPLIDRIKAHTVSNNVITKKIYFID